MKDDSGSYAVLTEQGSSTSQMTAAKVMDIISRLPGCAGQAADAVSAYTQVKMEVAPTLLKIPKSECPDILVRLLRHQWPKSWSSMEDPIVALERNLYGHLLTGLLWERSFEKVLLEHGWEKVPNLECFFVNREKGLLLSGYVDDIKLAGKEQNLNPIWKILMKDIDLGEPTSFLDHVYLGCTQRECQTRKDIADNYRSLFESRISAGLQKNCQKQKPRRNLMPKRYLHGPMTWKVTQRNAWKDIANLRIKQLSNSSKSRRHAWMIINLKNKTLGSVGELSTVCSQIVLKCLYLARIGRPDILWSVNKTASCMQESGPKSQSRQRGPVEVRHRTVLLPTHSQE